MDTQYRQTPDIAKNIKKLRLGLPQIVETLYLEDGMDNIGRWSSVVDKKLLPRLAGDFPLVAAICGGGSSGKSTVFNSMIQEQVSPTGGTAGINRRILAAAGTDMYKSGDEFERTLSPFGIEARPLSEKHDLIEPGNPLYVLKDRVPANVILLDTPDFDTGLNGNYTNRDMARQAFELADILIYIFTNANYNNRDNTDFIARMLTDIGQRRCFLVYRVYGSYGSAEIQEHAQTVARNLYGESAKEYVLGVYRAEEDNRVATDEKFADLRAVNVNDSVSLIDELAKLDAHGLRMDLTATVYDDVMAKAKDMLANANASRTDLYLYRDTLQAAQSQCIQSALQHFPIKPVLERFSQIWFESDPNYLKYMRKAGHFIELPFKAAINAAKWFAGKKGSDQDARAHLNRFSHQFEEDLLSAVTTLWRQSIEKQLPVSKSQKGHFAGGHINAHPVVAVAQKRLQEQDRTKTLASMIDSKDAIIEISKHIESDLFHLADQFRQKAGFMFKIRQTLSALLTVLPATVAVTYILSTGDPVGAAGIKVKLTGLFGLKDLYALVAIPATTGLKKADRTQLEALLAPITRTWLNDKLNTIQILFEEKITSGIFAAADKALVSSGKMIEDMERALSRL
ncbi:MAG: dynamin family protein [Thermodesulfobacteriota bacterium]